MPFALIIIGLLLVVTGANDTYKQTGSLLVGDLTGPGNFTYWILAFGSLGAIGYNETLRPFSRAFMVLIFVALIVRNGGFFDKFSKAIGTNSTASGGVASGTANLAEGSAKLAATASNMSKAFDAVMAFVA
jgi:hypothetical protein